MTLIIRMPQLIEKTRISRAHIYALLSRGEFPRPIRLGRRAVGWREDDIEAWLASRPEAGSWRL
jgi:prophage regulatory protein